MSDIDWQGVAKCLRIALENRNRELAELRDAGLSRFTDAEVNAEFKHRNPPPPNPQAPTMKEKA